jgi:hypothetical protein
VFPSSLAGGGHVYFTDLEGATTVVRESPQFEIASRNELGGAVAATMAISQVALLVRTGRRLVCIASGGASSPCPKPAPVAELDGRLSAGLECIWSWLHGPDLYESRFRLSAYAAVSRP